MDKDTIIMESGELISTYADAQLDEWLCLGAAVCIVVLAAYGFLCAVRGLKA